MDRLSAAIVLATSAHAGQVDKGGNPYILHPLRIMMKMPCEVTRMLAVLHDVVEDTYVTMADIRNQFGREIADPLELLTHTHGTYKEYVQKLAVNDLARTVKIGDIIDNMDLTRIANPQLHDHSRMKRYVHAREYLEQYR